MTDELPRCLFDFVLGEVSELTVLPDLPGGEPLGVALRSVEIECPKNPRKRSHTAFDDGRSLGFLSSVLATSFESISIETTWLYSCSGKTFSSSPNDHSLIS